MGLKLHGSSTWSSTTLRIRIFSCWRVHETLGKGLTPAGTFPAGGDERSGGSDVEVAFLVATGAEAEPLLRLVRTPREEMVAGKPWWTCRFARGQGSGAAVILQSGYDKTNTAHSLTCLLETVRPELVLQVGVGGAFREAGLGLGDIVVATEEIYADTGVRTPDGWISTKEFNSPLLEKDGHLFWNRFPLDDGLASRCAKVIADGEWGASTPKIVAGPCVTLPETSERVTHGPATILGVEAPHSPSAITFAQREASPSSRGKRFQNRWPSFSRSGELNSLVEIQPSGVRTPVSA